MISYVFNLCSYRYVLSKNLDIDSPWKLRFLKKMRKSDFSWVCVFEVFSLVLVVHFNLFYSVLRCNDRRMTFQWVLDGSFWSFITKNRACNFICTSMRSFAQKASRNYSGFNDCIWKLHAILHTFSLKN